MGRGIITLTTDFGLKDPYAGTMKGVILSVNPGAMICDISHQIDPGAIETAARMLKETCPFFPPGTVHVAVVDPGVGGARRPILVRTRGHLFVGPDNGIFWPIISGDSEAQLIHLTETAYFRPTVSPTFHGRDIFAPVAAHLSLRVDPSEMGVPIDDPVRLDIKAAQSTEDGLTGEITTVDRFGNLITNIGKDVLIDFLSGHQPLIRSGDRVITALNQKYTDVGPDEVLALFSSSGYLEIAVNRGRAADRFGKDAGELRGQKVAVERQ
ncbi:MAG: SAM-dependent chlorinase/fluorinase [Deltaproteobacteria bacterium]|nr:SAM-dependent chlorinase/fluorinase [Deltaproteobacteria bacterium]